MKNLLSVYEILQCKTLIFLIKFIRMSFFSVECLFLNNKIISNTSCFDTGLNPNFEIAIDGLMLTDL